jgi:hypothetical protein
MGSNPITGIMNFLFVLSCVGSRQLWDGLSTHPRNPTAVCKIPISELINFQWVRYSSLADSDHGVFFVLGTGQRVQSIKAETSFHVKSTIRFSWQNNFCVILFKSASSTRLHSKISMNLQSSLVGWPSPFGWQLQVSKFRTVKFHNKQINYFGFSNSCD